MRIVPTAASLAALTVTPAFADVTALDVWNSWKSLAGTYNQTISVENEDYSGGTLTLTGVTTTMELPEGGSAEGNLSELVLEEQGDGTVAMTMPAEYPFTFSSKGSEGEDMNMAMRMIQSGLELVASGDPEAISYAFTAPTMEVVLDEMTENGEPIDMTLSANLSGTEGTYVVGSGEPQSIDSEFRAEALALVVAMNEPEEDVDFDMTMTMSDIVSSSTGSLSPFTGGQDLAALLRAGLATEGTMTSGRSTFEISADDGENPFTLTGGAESGKLDFSLDPDGMVYSGGNTGVTAVLQITSMPLPPFTLDIDQTSGEVRMPLIATDEPKEFGLVLDLKGLNVGENAWAMIDPTGGLPHEPANLAIDLSGQGRWTVDVSDPAAMASMTDDVPGEIESLSLNRLLVSVLGAELTGSGDFAFDNATAPPAPAGLINLKLVGANGLLDNLVALGLLPEDQAMGARMMLGLFARPGEGGGDEMVSTIEVKEDGSILANGQRIK